ncbi:MAG: glycosyltransferase [Candidatus Pacebacteria bacterium]|nr:glycosyltransferase [Candidatus Paceibacterota bacterium]MDD3919250.1 glycosyltransferase [Candidatus Paceibacterota bacterium]
MELSIIIPTLNEEKLLPFLLELIEKENVKKNIEVIIADAGSTDQTVKIAKDYGCKIVPGGLPARGRNSGAKHATAPILFFLDADVLFKPGTIAKSLEQFKKKKLDAASFGIYTQEKNLYMNKTTMNLFYNYPQKLLKKISPMGAMGIMAKKSIFEKVGGFDEEIKLAEDHYFVKKVSKIGKYGIIRHIKLYMPLRRFRQDGYFKTFFKYAYCFWYMNLKGPVKSEKVHYNFGHYNKDKIKKKKHVNLRITKK